jgi:uncharacterized protein YjiS (DUF1127 family)
MTSDSRAWRAIRAGARRAATWPFRVAAARATLRALANMDRRELADIGLNPCDLRDVSALPLDRDPTELLKRRAGERRRDAFGAPTFIWGGDPPEEDPDDRPPRRLRRRVCDRARLSPAPSKQAELRA